MICQDKQILFLGLENNVMCVPARTSGSDDDNGDVESDDDHQRGKAVVAYTCWARVC